MCLCAVSALHIACCQPGAGSWGEMVKGSEERGYEVVGGGSGGVVMW